MPPELPILDGAVCSHCECIAESAVLANETWNHCAQSGDMVCPDCSETCEECGDVFSVGENAINRHSVCHDCEDNVFTYCADCGDRIRQDDATGGNRCEGCEENYSSCNACGEVFHLDNMTSTDDGYFCLGCADSRREETGDCDGIHDHGYKPSPEFHKTRADIPMPVYLGVEIECEDTRGVGLSSGVEEVPAGFYCKHDGSLTNGFEMVSHPRTWNSWREFNLDFLDSLKGMGFRSYNTNTCGMHVHVSRNVLSRLDVYKLLRFCKNAPLFLLRVSRRKKANLERWARVFEGSNEEIILKAKGQGGYERYEAINLTNRNTVEFRLFRGTLDKFAVRRNLAFVQALVMFVKETSIKRLSSGIFQHWLKTRGGEVIGQNHARSLLESFTFVREEETVCA